MAKNPVMIINSFPIIYGWILNNKNSCNFFTDQLKFFENEKKTIITDDPRNFFEKYHPFEDLDIFVPYSGDELNIIVGKMVEPSEFGFSSPKTYPAIISFKLEKVLSMQYMVKNLFLKYNLDRYMDVNEDRTPNIITGIDCVY